MANFLIAIDPDTERRRRFGTKVMPKLPPVPGLVSSSLEVGECLVAWAAAPSAPITSACQAHKLAVEWGEPIDDLSRKVGVGELLRLWPNEHSRGASFYNGYYAAMVYDTARGLAVGGDLLGIYPIYHWSCRDVVLVGSSPSLFQDHPSFAARLDLQGLAGILVSMHICGGRTLLEGVRRLDAGCLLLWNQEDGVYQEKQYRVRVSTDKFDLPFSAHVEALDEAVGRAIRRIAPKGRKYQLMLSGGLDSRMIGGYLKEQGVDTEAVTMGAPRDIEMKLAKKVAGELGFAHRMIDLPYDSYNLCAQRQARWEAMSNGFNDIFNWGIHQWLSKSVYPVIMGHILDAVIGTRSIGFAYRRQRGKLSFDTFFEYVNSWGIRIPVLRRLLRRDVFGHLADDVVEAMRDEYTQFSESGAQQAWCFNLYNRQRFHVGCSAWALSFGSWPVIPALDRKLLECAGSMPAASIAERRAQTELLRTRFPRLAALPLDRNSHNTSPIQPRLRYQLAEAIHKKMRALLPFSNEQGTADLYYYRTYDIDNPGWSAIREMAEPNREGLYELLDGQTLNKLLPPPRVQAQLKDRIVDASGLKLLLGLMMWSGGGIRQKQQLTEMAMQ